MKKEVFSTVKLQEWARKGVTWLQRACHAAVEQHWPQRIGHKTRHFLSNELFIKAHQTSFLFLGDVVVVFFSLLLSAALFESDFASYSSGFLLKNMLIVTLVTVAVLLSFDIYGDLNEARPSWPSWLRPSTAPFSLILPLFVSFLLALPLIRLLGIIEHFSSLTPFLNAVVSFLGMTGLRMGFDAWNARRERKRLTKATEAPHRVEALLVGTFADLAAFLEESRGQDYQKIHFLAAVTTNALDCGRYLGDIAVLGSIDDLEHLLAPQGNLIQPFPYVFVVGKNLSGRTLQKISKMAHGAHVPVLTLLRPYRTRSSSLDELSQK